MGLDHARPPGVRPDVGRRGHDRTARAGPRQRDRHGHRGAPARRGVQPARARHRRPPDLRHRQRRRPAGGRRVRGLLARRPPAARQARRALRRQPDPARRPDGVGLQRGRARPLRRLWLAHAAGRGRQRRRGDLGRHRCRQGGRPAVDHRRAHAHRVRQPEQAGHAEGARRPARARRGPAGQGGLRLGPRPHVLRPRRGGRGVPPRDRRGQGPGRRMGVAPRPLRGGAPRPGRGAPAPARRPAARRLGAGPAGVRGRQRGRHAQRQPGHDPGARRRAAGAVRRLGRPLRVEPDRRQGQRPRPLRGRPCRPQPALRRARARDGRDREWHRLPRRLPPLLRDVPHVQRLHARVGAARRTVRPARDLRVDARLRRPRRGRPDAPAGRALRGPPRDPEPVVRAAGRRQRGGGGVGAGGRAAVDRGRRARPGRPGLHPPEAADAGGLARARHARACDAAAMSCARHPAGRRS